MTKYFVLAAFFFGFILEAFYNCVWDAQEAYIEGRQSILAKTVRLQGSAPCDLEIPLSVLGEMVNAGALVWHEVCEKEADQ